VCARQQAPALARHKHVHMLHAMNRFAPRYRERFQPVRLARPINPTPTAPSGAQAARPMASAEDVRGATLVNRSGGAFYFL
jgi:hypothetical protein